MRNLIISISTGLTLLAAVACDSGPSAPKDPPVLKVTSPKRSLIQDHAGQLMVAGTVTPNANGDLLDKVLVNDIQATLNADGSFNALIDIAQGASLIKTVARDKNGGEASDVRAVQAGQLRPVGADVENAVTAAMSTQAFAKISAAAGPIIKGMNLSAMLAPMQPMVHMGDENGEDCLFARVYVDDVKFTDVKISLTPVQGGLGFSAEIDGLDVPAHARYAAACIHGSNNLEVTADSVVVSGTLLVTPNGMNGFDTKLDSPVVSLTNFHLDASGIPGTILDMINMDSAIQYIVSKGAELAMGPMMNSALGGLGGPKQLALMGKTMDVQVSPSDISFDPNGALVTLNMKMLIEGSESSPGFIYTDNGMPNMDPGNGFQLGLADDLANEMMAELNAVGMLNLNMPASGGTFDGTTIQMSLAPMISADPKDGQMRIILGDMLATYTDHGTPVGKAAINAKIDVKIDSVANGYAVALKLGTPDISFTMMDDIANATRLDDKDLATASAACLDAQIDSLSKLLVDIPLPAVAGLQMRNLSIGADSGYVMVKGTLE